VLWLRCKGLAAWACGIDADERVSDEFEKTQLPQHSYCVGWYQTIGDERFLFYVWNDRFVLRSDSLGRLELLGHELSWNRSKENIVTFEIFRSGEVGVSLYQRTYPINDAILEREEFDYYTMWHEEDFDLLLFARNIMRSPERQNLCRIAMCKESRD